ncbi:hypothetical protein N7517_002037 [Penicillium concentricum]|uniref:Mid2 domain-containing protein n=1 Tax=Penicillium concentricum TaxID=293559 RepID=A0A9W9STC3_9EURO|nr:uncharacterized protein N7517_002037 [Penicillium concentricum]KAJ5384126.1 hypothetical protein N7517_002037 [Penicillium concentricum]
MRISIFALCTVLCSRVRAQPYASEITWISATTTSVECSWPLSEPTEVAQVYGKRRYGDILQARDTTAAAEVTSTADATTADATTDTTAAETTEATSAENTTSEKTTSETTTSTTEATTASPTSETTTETTETTETSETPTSTTETTSSTASSSSVAASSTSATTSTPTSTSSASSTTSATPTATGSMSKAELADWNHKGNIAAIVFGACFIAIFLGVAIAYYALGRAKARRIAANQLADSSQSYSKIPLVAVKEPPTDLEVNRSSTMYTNNPQAQYFPAGGAPSVSNYSDTPSAVSPITADHSFPREHIPRGHQ